MTISFFWALSSRGLVLPTHDCLRCAYWRKKLLAKPRFISCAIYKQINFLQMEPTTKQLKIAAAFLWKRRFNYPRALKEKKKRSTSKGCWLPVLRANAWRGKMRSQIILLWMRDEKRGSTARSDFVHVLTNQSILPSSPISAAGCALFWPYYFWIQTHFNEMRALKSFHSAQSIFRTPLGDFLLIAIIIELIKSSLGVKDGNAVFRFEIIIIKRSSPNSYHSFFTRCDIWENTK